jgi:hypothetical protein
LLQFSASERHHDLITLLISLCNLVLLMNKLHEITDCLYIVSFFSTEISMELVLYLCIANRFLKFMPLSTYRDLKEGVGFVRSG